MKYKLVRQHDAKDCGAACLASICSNYGLKIKLSQSRELTETDINGTSIYNMVSGASKIGFDCEALSGDKESFLNYINSQKCTLPIVAHIINEEELYHFIIIYKITYKHFIIGDPDKGILKISHSDFFERWTGNIITYTPNSYFMKGDEVTQTYKKFINIIYKQKSLMISIFLTSILIILIGIMSTFVFEILIDNISGQSGINMLQVNDHSGHNHTSYIDILVETVFSNINYIFIIVIFLFLLQTIIQIIRGLLQASISKKIEETILYSFYKKLFCLPIDFWSNRTSGDIISRYEEVSLIRELLSDILVSIFIDTLMVIFSAVILYRMDKTLFLIGGVSIMINSIIVLKFKKPIENINSTIMNKNAQTISYLKETIDGIQTIKIHCAEDEINNKLKLNTFKLVKSIKKGSIIYIVQDSLSEIVMTIGSILILWLGFTKVLSNEISLGTLITFNALLTYFLQPINNMIELQPNIQKSIIAMDRLNDVLDLEIEDKNTNFLKNNLASGDIIFSNVSFGYKNKEILLKNINLTIPRGNKVAIVGSNGSGKTTIAKLLIKLYLPLQGEIYIGNTNINDITLTELRHNIAYVSNDVFLFSDTIFNNLTLGESGITLEKCRELCVKCGIDSFINELPLGYDTILEERGSNLSTGQKQRLSLVRALLREPKIIILDEATSNIDTLTKALIQEIIDNIMEVSDLTCITITHNLTSLKNYDRIFVIDNGSIESRTNYSLISYN